MMVRQLRMTVAVRRRLKCQKNTWEPLYSKIVSWLYYLLKSKLTADLAKAKFVTGIAMGTAAVMDENAEGWGGGGGGGG